MLLASLCYTSSTFGLLNPMLVATALMMGLVWTALAARSERKVRERSTGTLIIRVRR